MKLQNILFPLLILSSYLIPPQVQARDRVDLIIIEKAARRLSLHSGKHQVRQYRIALGRTPIGAKECQGDGKTPEGEYLISGRNVHSAFHRSLRISYPNQTDRHRAKTLKCSPGGDIMIHGLPNGRGWLGASHRLSDWTEGCIALTDEEIEEIWNLVRDGTKVVIKP